MTGVWACLLQGKTLRKATKNKKFGKKIRKNIFTIDRCTYMQITGVELNRVLFAAEMYFK
jgi:hypothetical protein